jgi:hypothetical protein
MSRSTHETFSIQIEVDFRLPGMNRSAVRSVETAMKLTILSLACALLSPLAFGQTSPTEDENPATEPAAFAQTSPTEDENATTGTVPTKVEAAATAAAQTIPTEDENPVTEPSLTKAEATATVNGTILAFTAEELLVLKTTADDPMTFVLGKTAYVDKAGNEITSAMVQEGAKVQVTYDMKGEQMVVNRVVLEE